jgi:hypothetical protein
MFYEDVKVEKGETVSGLGVAHGYKASDWPKIWADPPNAALLARRSRPEGRMTDGVSSELKASEGEDSGQPPPGGAKVM